jgi:hypothetical protein
MTAPFSKRNSFHQASEVEITVREDAPRDLREYVLQLAYQCRFTPSKLRDIVCAILRKSPDRGNWSEFPNIDGEVARHLAACPWYKVYDIIEQIVAHGTKSRHSYDMEKFANELNEYFVENGIGWELSGGLVEMRGPQHFQALVKTSITSLQSSGYLTAQNELQEALHDLSRRPKPDITGAIHHAMGALESTARKICGNDKLTLGEVVKKFPGIVPRPLDEAVSKAWGYASESGRHVKEGNTASHEEALLVVGLASALCAYFSAKGMA